MSRTRNNNAQEKTEGLEGEDEAAPTESEMNAANAAPPSGPEQAPEPAPEPEPEPEQPMSTGSSPAHTNGTNGHSGGPSPEPAEDDHHSDIILPPLHALSLKSTPTADEDSLNSNDTSQTPPSGLAAAPAAELDHAAPMAELVAVVVAGEEEQEEP
ncbi:GATA type zinc finger protein asd-4-like [Pollicipes pollicipes]|uniref:GATA type zinc finger protein asd-4-like n=1 Tax=Pollicipes pollicipes TaxID=41117 RepID=UPI001885019D|nr:GATA type zinc finger protein asd-4-like [Pollicipes pollicipes]